MKPSTLSLPAILLSFVLSGCAQQSDTKQDTEQNAKSAEIVHEEIKVERLAALIGEWHPAPEGFGEDTKAWMSKNDISDYYVGFTWGTDKSWINFGDYRVVSDKIREHGKGIIAYHHGLHEIAFREQGSDSVSVDGTVEIIDPLTFKRHIKAYWPKGLVRNRMDLWAIDKNNPNCMDWTITFTKDGKEYPNPSSKWCKEDA